MNWNESESFLRFVHFFLRFFPRVKIFPSLSLPFRADRRDTSRYKMDDCLVGVNLQFLSLAKSHVKLSRRCFVSVCDEHVNLMSK